MTAINCISTYKFLKYNHDLGLFKSEKDFVVTQCFVFSLKMCISWDIINAMNIAVMLLFHDNNMY